jgi:hypothetical protein
MSELHVAEVGELFMIDDEFRFMSDQNMLEYDFIVIDVESLIETVEKQASSKIKDRFDDLKDFISKKNIPIVFFCSSSGAFSEKTKKAESSIYEYLGIELEEKSSQGKRIEFNKETLFTNFLNKHGNDFDYSIGFPVHPGVSIGNAKSRHLSIGFYTKDFVFLPIIGEDSGYASHEFLLELYEVCRAIRKDNQNIQLPDWTNDYLLPGERNERENLTNIEKEIALLIDEKTLSQNRLNSHLPLKQLWSGTGINLENAAKMVFEELGFTLLHSEPGRDDIIMKWGEQIVIVEVKGQSKSAAEKNAAQLEKWVSSYKADHDDSPKGILLVNTYRELSIENRKLPSFPDQMLKYSIDRNHCLLTTVQLCTLMLHCRANPHDKNVEVDKMISTTGVYESLNSWKDYIESPVKKPIEKKAVKKIK